VLIIIYFSKKRVNCSNKILSEVALVRKFNEKLNDLISKERKIFKNINYSIEKKVEHL
jgi:hypothetical protein